MEETPLKPLNLEEKVLEACRGDYRGIREIQRATGYSYKDGLNRMLDQFVEDGLIRKRKLGRWYRYHTVGSPCAEDREYERILDYCSKPTSLKAIYESLKRGRKVTERRVRDLVEAGRLRSAMRGRNRVFWSGNYQTPQPFRQISKPRRTSPKQPRKPESPEWEAEYHDLCSVCGSQHVLLRECEVCGYGYCMNCGSPFVCNNCG